MKTNSTNNLRNTIIALLLSVAFSNTFSQTVQPGNNAISNLSAKVDNNNIVINWNVTEAIASNICEVQASKDGKNFSTIGIVLGADPKQNNNSFAFKQNLTKMKAGQVYYRVLSVGTNYTATASNVVKTTK